MTTGRSVIVATLAAAAYFDLLTKAGRYAWLWQLQGPVRTDLSEWPFAGAPRLRLPYSEK